MSRCRFLQNYSHHVTRHVLQIESNTWFLYILQESFCESQLDNMRNGDVLNHCPHIRIFLLSCDPIIDEGLLLLDDMLLWMNKQRNSCDFVTLKCWCGPIQNGIQLQDLQWVCHTLRKRNRTNKDETFKSLFTPKRTMSVSDLPTLREDIGQSGKRSPSQCQT